MNKYNAVLFDLDGTLLDTSDGILKATLYTIEQMGYESLTTEKMLSFIGPPIKNSLKRTYDLTEEDAIKAMNVWRDYYSNTSLLQAKVYDGIFKLFAELKKNNIKIGVATYKREDYALKILQHYKISEHCDSIKGADIAGKYTKTDVIRVCLDELGITNKQNAVMIGDSDNDAIGAREIGVDFIGVTYGFGFKTLADVQEFDHIGCAGSTEELGKILCNSIA